jgi:4-aminobutyrate aminotransferase-like enzyme
MNRMGMINAYDPASAPALDADEQAVLARRQRILGPAYRLFYQHPLHVVRAEGVWLYDKAGRRYLDAYNNVPSVGHCHPHVVGAVARQMATLNSHTRYVADAILDYAERLLATFPAGIDRVMFTCTGSEANDLAVRVAKAATGGSGIIATRLAYHGVTETVSGFSPSLGPHVPRGPGVFLVDAPTDPGAMGSAGVGRRFAEGVRASLDHMRENGIRPAALIVDTIFSSDGVFADPPGFLAEAVADIRKAGGIFIADEVQAGFGRTGEAFWGHLRHRVVPDIVTMGKPMGNGYPVAAMATREDHLADFGARARYFNTFGGSSAAMAAASAVLDVIELEGLMANAAATGQVLKRGLADLAGRHPALGGMRGAGLFIGVDIVRRTADGAEPAGDIASAVVNSMRERGVLISASGPDANVLKIRPPLPFGTAEAGLFLDVLDETLQATGPLP